MSVENSNLSEQTMWGGSWSLTRPLVHLLTATFPSLPEEKAADYVISSLIAVMFPIVRYILDKTLYHVSWVSSSVASWFGQRRLPSHVAFNIVVVACTESS